MNKKAFKNSPALAFIKPQNNTQYETHELSNEQTHETTQYDIQEQYSEHTHEDTQLLKRTGYVRTQGRKGHKKPRINLAFDSDIFLDKIRVRAEREGKSITQFVNDAICYYFDNAKKIK